MNLNNNLMTLNNEKIELITDCNAEALEIKNSKFCVVVSECDFEGSSFNRTNLSGNHFEYSNMSGDYFEEVGLSGAAFERSNMSGAAFDEVNLSGAAFEGCDFSRAAISDCKLDGMTIDGFNVLELIEFYKNHKENEL